MRPLAAFLIGLGLVAPAAAQSGSADVSLLPIPENVPLIMFAPESLAGPMLGPLGEPKAADAAVAEPSVAEPGVAAAVVPDGGSPAPSEPDPDAASAAMPETDASAIPEEDPDIAPEAIPLEPPAETASVPPDASPAVLPDGSTVIVIVENVQTGDGSVNVAICDKGLSREGCPYDTAVPAVEGFVEAKFDGIPPGTYAVVGYHDVNGNDLFDRFLGMPREPYALSSLAAESLVPKFQDAALKINEGENVVIIRLKRFGGY
ncbi:MAG TPA: DUF2141 domain-containing protein [Propylenella sp.]